MTENLLFFWVFFSTQDAQLTLDMLCSGMTVFFSTHRTRRFSYGGNILFVRCDVRWWPHFPLPQPTAQCPCISAGCSSPSWSAQPAVCGTRPRHLRVLCSLSTAACRRSAARGWSWNWSHTDETAAIPKFSDRQHLEQTHSSSYCAAKRHADLTRLAEDGWGWVLGASLGRRRCRDASGQFLAVERGGGRPKYVSTDETFTKTPDILTLHGPPSDWGTFSKCSQNNFSK